jgi:response regulator RpfG family c-di-GMP phosphodiesterase
MRIKVLLFGNDPPSLVADAQLLRERNILVFPAFNLQNTDELIQEIKPDLIFFDANSSNAEITQVYNDIVNGIRFTNIPVVFTLSEDDVYLVTRKRTEEKSKRTLIADNMIDAIRMALSSKNFHRKEKAATNISNKSTGPNRNGNNPGSQMKIPFC